MFKYIECGSNSTPYQTQYANILRNLIYKPNKRVKSRNGLVNSRFFETIRVNLQKEYPLMDIKKIKFSNIYHELIWFLRGGTNIKYLVDNKCFIWNDDAFRYYNEKYKNLCGGVTITKEEFIEKVKNGDNLKIQDQDFIEKYDKTYYWFGDLDNIYGHQWTQFGELNVNQITNTINLLKQDPNNRRITVTAHNPSDISDNNVGLPSCHNMFQFYTTPIPIEKRIILYNQTCGDGNNNEILTTKILDDNNIPKYMLSCWFNLRSNDIFLGNPYNIASYALLTHIIAKTVNMIPCELTCSMIDCHIYDKHIEPAMEWLDRYYNDNKNDYYCKSKIKINKKLVLNSCGDYNTVDFNINDITLSDYNPQPYIKAVLLT